MMRQKLQELANEFCPKSILDIGANKGEFSLMCHSIWPNSNIILIEGNRNCQKDLDQLQFKSYITLLSDSEKDVIFYINNDNLKCTGSSYYKEITHHYHSAIEEERSTSTLDILFPCEEFDFIKIDTQGSELDILKGGKNIVQKAKYILLEVSIQEYNKNAPLHDDVIEYMKSIGFDNFETIDHHINANNVTFQKDILFRKSI